MLIRLREAYTLANERVRLDVVVGEGQRGFIEVRLDGTPLANGHEITGLEVGSAADLAGRKLRIIATVTDTNLSTNRTSVTYTLSGGARTQSWNVQHEVDSEGETVDYDAIFRLL